MPPPSWRDRAQNFVRQYGSAAKTVASVVLNVVAPGSGALVNFVRDAFDAVEKEAEQAWEEQLREVSDRNQEALERLGLALALMQDNLQGLCHQAKQPTSQPPKALEAQLREALAKNPQWQTAANQLKQLNDQFGRLHDKIDVNHTQVMDTLQEVLTRLNRLDSPAPPLAPVTITTKGTTHVAKITRINPACMVILVDQSGSMRETFGLPPRLRKADTVAAGINKFLQDLVIKCGSEHGMPDYVQIGIIGYGGSSARSAFEGELAGREDLVSISELEENDLRIVPYQELEDDGQGGQITIEKEQRIWIDPRASGKTPLGDAFRLATELVSKFLDGHPNCFPPIVLNFTDGIPSGDPKAAAEKARQLCRLRSSDGNVLLFNAHLSDKEAQPILFPETEEGFPDDFARYMFRLSSTVPESLVELARNEGLDLTPGARGFVFNANLDAVLKFLTFGTTKTRNVN